MLTHSEFRQSEVIEAFNSTSRYLDVILTIISLKALPIKFALLNFSLIR